MSALWPIVGTVSVPDTYGPPENLIAAPVFGYGLTLSDQIQDGDVVIIDTSNQGNDGELRVVVWHEQDGIHRGIARVWSEGEGCWLVYPGRREPPVFVPPANEPFIVGVIAGAIRPFANDN